MPRTPKYPHQLRTKVSTPDLETITSNAARAGLSVCAYLRETAARRQVRSTVEISAVNAINRVGAMVKMMMRDGRDLAPDILAALIDLRAAVEDESRRADEN